MKIKFDNYAELSKQITDKGLELTANLGKIEKNVGYDFVKAGSENKTIYDYLSESQETEYLKLLTRIADLADAQKACAQLNLSLTREFLR